ncbi:hypothetical protein [uncultured Kocuria sp.]|uniref:hypothetical protein n=1 Tax=uncultured Kocuria sp. TaxID=259305 RepID=UPI0026104692|nr:hypothetical protein [uncultured Kocuria sp.]
MSSVDPPENRAFAPADPGFLVSIATFAFVALGLEAVVDGTVLTLTGEIPDVYPLGWQVFAWLCLGAAWFAIQRGLVAWLRHRASDPALPPSPGPPPSLAVDHRRTTTALFLFVLAVLLGVILPVFLVGEWRVQPIQLYLDLYADYGGGAWLGMVGFAAYHVGRSLLLALVLTCVQRAVELRRPLHWTQVAPLGGLALGLLLALPGLVLGGWASVATAVVCCTLLGMVHNLTGRSLRWTAPAAVAVLLFV